MAESTGKGWSDSERLTYLVALMEQSSPRLDFNGTPRPEGRSLIACQRMVQRLKDTVKDDLAALKAGQPLPGDADGDDAPKTPAKTPKRKAVAKDTDGSPKKRGRKPKKQEQDDEQNDQAEQGIKEKQQEEGEDEA
ncbi:hypothetical protein M011DRAFT_489451 [Sporormia fimetaria CBS 119925]|uniref:Uncharacterized protein n=1 Tax=Sporormia fimetaria CBS 119925 TaxID=1340428 RepID=A0A6A6V3Q4_9PLEO|nr:hypothetical protein M011DRAFT_489451 [Sporormia fimetaria CBS 119925]